jgi:hypothetical protein
VGDELLVIRQNSTRSERLTTLGRAADFAGVGLGLTGSYPPSTTPEPDAPLPVDPAAARWFADWFPLEEAALRCFAEEVGQPMEPVLWPEHLDLGLVLDAVNYGCSPGDAAMPEPYHYVGPHEGPPSGHAFWNTSFGATAAASRIRDEADTAVLFVQGRMRILEDRSAT